MKEFIHGPFQKEWIQALRDNPNEHMEGQLGMKYKNKKEEVCKYCCLGKGATIVCDYEWNYVSERDQFNMQLLDLSAKDRINQSDLPHYDSLGLYSEIGVICDEHDYQFKTELDRYAINEAGSLVELNDEFSSWIKMPEFEGTEDDQLKFVVEGRFKTWLYIAYLLEEYPRCFFAKPK